MESKKAEGIKNLLKIIIPLAFPLAGSFIFDLITNSVNRDSDIDLSDSPIQLEPSYRSSSIREEEEEMDSFHCAARKLVQTENPCSTGRLVSSEFSRQASCTEEIIAAQASESSSEVPVNRVQDDQRMVEDVDSLKRMVSALEEQAASIKSQFHDYYDMKEQESKFQKMQIMCLGMKLEQLESQNQRLEAAAEEFTTMRAKFDELHSKSKKIWRKNKQDLDAIDERIVALGAKEAEMATKCQGFEQYMEEMKQLTLQLQNEKGSNKENVEVIVERSMPKLSSGRDVLDELEALRDRWAADMEEMIYLGWITAWLQHDLLVLDSEVGTPAIDDAPAQHKGEKMVVTVVPSNEVELCKAASASSSSASSEMRGAAESSCMMGFAGGCRKGGSWGIIGRPRLLRRLRGWAGGKGKSRRQCKIEFPTSPM